MDEAKRARLAARVLTTPARRKKVQRLLDEYSPKRGTGRVTMCLLAHESCPISEHYVEARERQVKETFLKPTGFGVDPQAAKKPGIPAGYERVTRPLMVPDPSRARAVRLGLAQQKYIPVIEALPVIANLYEAQLDDYLESLNEEDKETVRAAAKEYQERLREHAPTGEPRQTQFGSLSQLTRTLEIERPYFQLLNIPGTKSPYGIGPTGKFVRVRVPGTRLVLNVDMSELASRQERRKYPGTGPVDDRRIWAAIDAYMANKPGEYIIEQLEPERRQAWWRG